MHLMTEEVGPRGRASRKSGLVPEAETPIGSRPRGFHHGPERNCSRFRGRRYVCSPSLIQHKLPPRLEDRMS